MYGFCQKRTAVAMISSGGCFLSYRKFLRIPYKIKNNYRRVCPSEARVLRRKRNMPRKRPAAGENPAEQDSLPYSRRQRGKQPSLRGYLAL